MSTPGFQRFDIRVPLGQVLCKLDQVLERRPLPKPALDLEQQLRASLAARGIDNAAIARRVGATAPVSDSGGTHARVGRAIASEAALAELCAKLERALDSLAGERGAVVEDSSIGALLSPSQVRAWSDCAAKWMFKYLLGLPDPPNANLALGRAVHVPIGENYRQKATTRTDLPADAAVAIFRDAWALEIQEAALRDDDPAELGAMGAFMVAQYISEVAPLIQPAIIERDGEKVPAVELEVSGTIAGVQVRGRIDVMAEDGLIDDVKTASKSPSGIADDRRFQLATYTQLVPGASGRGRIDTLTKTKTTKLVSQTFDVTPDDLRQTATLYPMAQDGMRSGLYMPNRNSMLCSRRNCPFWQACEREFGGHVKES